MSGEPIVVARRLGVLDPRGGIAGLDLALPAGPVGALVGAPADGTSALASVLAGCARPFRGSLAVAGKPPFGSRAVRARIGALLEEPAPPEVGSVRALVSCVRSLRGRLAPDDEWHEPLGLGRLERREVARLDRAERRALALGLALALEAPALLVLHEPLADVAGACSEHLGPLLRARARAGACVLVLTASSADAAALADDVATLERGRISRAIGEPDAASLAPGSPAELLVWADQARALASALVLEPEVGGVAWTGAESAAPVVVRGRDIEACAAAVARVAAAGGVRVLGLRAPVPSAPEVSAATAGVALAARHQAAYAAAARTHAGGASG